MNAPCGIASDAERRFLADCPPTCARDMVQIGPGSLRDYHALARFHYLAGKPATHVHVISARERRGAEIFGVLVVSMPVLNGRWRQLAWPGRYQSTDRAADARRINRELRTISRVIVDPRWRGLGLAKDLVETYLADPLTPATEAIAAMGAISPFFKAAGMREYRLPVSVANARLRDALHARRVRPSELCDPARAHRLLQDALIVKELTLWANASRSTRHLRQTEHILWPAARAMLAEPRAYAHTYDHLP